MPHIDSLIDDYVLNLLPAKERRAVEQHAAACPHCLMLLVDERARTAQLAASLRKSNSAPTGRLDALWPGVAAAVGLHERRSVTRAQVHWWFRWRTTLATIAVALVILASLLGTARRFDNWLMGTYTPTMASQTALPTASHTPTWTRVADQDSVAYAGAIVGRPPLRGTPEATWAGYSPQPQPNPSAPAAAGQ